MDNVPSGLRAIQTSSSLNLEVVALPKGFLKIVQIFLCLIAFAVVAAFDDSFSFNVECGGKTVERTFKFGYPFNLNDNGVMLPLCAGPDETTKELSVSNADQESSFKFFVF